MTNIAGSTVKGYYVEGVRVKRGPFNDSDHYGILLGKSDSGNYVTWQFHLDEDESVNPYWGHYHMEKRANALRDFHIRDLEGLLELSADYWDCECRRKYIHHNSIDRCSRCGAKRENCPDSRKSEVDEGVELAEGVSQATISAFERLRSHIGHNIEVAAYGDNLNVSVECVDCYEVLYSLDNPAVGGEES
jgi:hypothetical protein